MASRYVGFPQFNRDPAREDAYEDSSAARTGTSLYTTFSKALYPQCDAQSRYQDSLPYTSLSQRSNNSSMSSLFPAFFCGTHTPHSAHSTFICRCSSGSTSA